MSTTLKNLIRPLTGYTLVQKTALFFLADLAGPDNIARFYTETLAEWMCCNVRTAQRALRALEKKGDLTSLQEKAGRGYYHVYRVNVVNPLVAVPVVTEPLPATIPPTNGHVVPPSSTKPEPPTPEQLAEQYAQHKAKLEAKRAEIAAKRREEKRERPGRSARHQAGLV